MDFKPVSKVTSSVLNDVKTVDEREENKVFSNPLNIKDAKAGLALYFGVSEDDIQITING
ncbi:TPA: hypothetical protein PCO49_005281 [Klebsiella pneumoniae]|nr:hypothetical protein [Klebsiella pneumoniae]HBN2488082.1 hypothetical protein [Klebsiella oxytoca]HCA4373977.1 hypothetical protein [Klebsiella quasipneumoniae subsp. similipneumoniae]HDT3646539.1 hypothetical protein [Klebsiella pneumoniae subsp. pneumoniae]HDT5907114.1 hypothetical protein [Klebsiella michiganensis]